MVIRLRLSHLEAAARFRRPGYLQAIKTSGIPSGEFIELPEAVYREIQRKYSVAGRSLAGMGDKLERAISHIPGIKKLPCYDEKGSLKPETPCAKARDRLNAREPILPTIIKRIKGE